MLVDNDRAAAIKKEIERRSCSKLIRYAFDDLLTDHKEMLILLLYEWGELTEKQAADALDMDRIDFRIAREEWIAEAIEARP